MKQFLQRKVRDARNQAEYEAQQARKRKARVLAKKRFNARRRRRLKKLKQLTKINRRLRKAEKLVARRLARKAVIATRQFLKELKRLKRLASKPTKAEILAKRRAALDLGREARWAKYRKMQELGLPSPEQPKLGSDEFNKLQAEWYSKLSKSGFEDLEWVDSKTGIGQNSDYLRKSRNAGSLNYDEQTELYYAMWRNYVTHVKQGNKFDQLVVELHSEGVGYREILRIAKTKLGKTRSLFYLYRRMKVLKSAMMEFNNKHPDGLLATRADEAEKFQALLDFEPKPPPN